MPALNRRQFLVSFGATIGAIALGEVIPNNRVWFFPSTLRLNNVLSDPDILSLWRAGMSIPRKFIFGKDTKSPENPQPWEMSAGGLLVPSYRNERYVDTPEGKAFTYLRRPDVWRCDPNIPAHDSPEGMARSFSRNGMAS